MAIINDVPGLEVTVLVHSQPLAEYDSPQTIVNLSSDKNTTVKYIESHDNASFSVCVRANSQYAWDYRNHALQVKLHIDGIYVGNWILGCAEGVLCFDEIVYYDYKKKAWLQRKMQFSAVKIGESLRLVFPYYCTDTTVLQLRKNTNQTSSTATPSTTSITKPLQPSELSPSGSIVVSPTTIPAQPSP